MHGCESDAMFAMKGLMKKSPIPILLFCLSLSLCILGYQLRLFESALSEASGQNFNSLNNAIWNTVITLTSAGYGELFPKTFFGRIVGVIICLWGVLIISLFVVTVTDLFEFSENEENSYHMLIKLSYKNELKKKALKVLSASYTHRIEKDKNPFDTQKILSNFRHYRSAMLEFNTTSKVVRSLQGGKGSEFDVMTTILENIIDHV